jgi:hypothetical protein
MPFFADFTFAHDILTDELYTRTDYIVHVNTDGYKSTNSNIICLPYNNRIESLLVIFPNKECQNKTLRMSNKIIILIIIK